jgi:hypothetical protein
VKKIQTEIRDGVIRTIKTVELDGFCYCRKGDNGSFMIQRDNVCVQKWQTRGQNISVLPVSKKDHCK